MANDNNGFTLWFTGLSGAGKTTIAEIVGPELERRGILVDHLDGDVVRTHLSKGLGFSQRGPRHQHPAHRLRCELLSRNGAGVIVAAISPYRETRDMVRDLIGDGFVEVFVATCLEECERRDVKGLYAKARTGEIKEFTGISDPVRGAAERRDRRRDRGPLAEESAADMMAARGARLRARRPRRPSPDGRSRRRRSEKAT